MLFVCCCPCHANSYANPNPVQLHENQFSVFPHFVCQDQVSFSSALSAVADAVQWQVASSLLDGMIVFAVQPTRLSHSMVLTVDRSNWILALVGFCDIKTKAMSQDRINFNAAISSCEKAGKWTCALRLFEGLRKTQRFSSDVITLSSVLSACEKGGQWDVALLLLSQGHLRLSKPNEISFNAAISACEKLQRWQLSTDLLQEIFQRRLQPTEISYNAVISACQRAQEVSASAPSTQVDGKITRVRHF